MADGADDALHMEFLLPSGQNIGLDVSQGMTVGQVKDLVWSEAAAAHIAEDLEPDQVRCNEMECVCVCVCVLG